MPSLVSQLEWGTRLYPNKCSKTHVFTLALQAQTRRSHEALNTLVSFEAYFQMPSLNGAAGVSGQQRLQRQAQELTVRQARSERISSQKFDLSTVLLHNLLGKVDRLTAVDMLDEEAGGGVVTATVDAARYGG